MRRNRKRSFELPHHKPAVKQKKVKKQSKGILKSIVYAVCVCIFVALIACIGIGAGMYAAIVNEINEMNVQELALTRSSIVYYTDENGNSQEAATLFNAGNCIWVDSDEIPKVMKDAIVSIEDERFYEHSGIDIKRTAGATIGYIREKLGMGTAKYGGSTITQQVIKNITQEKDRNVTRKVKEMMRAVAIEKQLSKDEILTMYLNVIYLANNCYGVEAASNAYFDKPAAKLTLNEAALIAGITQKPSYYDPVKNPENATKKRNTVLKKMYELGKITKEEYDEATASELGLKGSHEKIKSKIYSYFVDTVVNEVIKDLQTEKGYSEAFATQQVFGGGLKIYTTMDKNIQDAVESVFESSSNFTGAAAKAQASMIIIDPSNGEIKGIAGGKGKKTDARGLNRATQSTRQPGSSLKPLSVYAPAIEKRIVTPTTSVVDEKIKIKNWEPQNAYSGFKGQMTVKKAVEISANIPAIKILQKVGIGTSYEYVTKKFGLTTVVDADKDLSPLALGGLTKGVTAKEMAAAYAVFANEGKYNEPHTYTKVLDSANRVLLEKSGKNEEVISASTAYTMSEMLYGVVNGSSGTGKVAKLANGISTYGKTGTTNENHDKWFVGYTPYYVGAVWFGFDQPKSITNAGISSSISARLWKKVMDKVHEGLAAGKIEAGDDLIEVFVCERTGQLAGENCNGVMEYFKRGQEPQTFCNGDHSQTGMFDDGGGENGFDEDGTPLGDTDSVPVQTEPPQSTGNRTIDSLQPGDYLPSQGSAE